MRSLSYLAFGSPGRPAEWAGVVPVSFSPGWCGCLLPTAWWGVTRPLEEMSLEEDRGDNQARLCLAPTPLNGPMCSVHSVLVGFSAGPVFASTWRISVRFLRLLLPVRRPA